MSEHTGSRGHDDPGLEFVTETRTTTLAEHWGLVLAYGVLTFAIGAVLAAWPGETLKVLAILLAIQLILMGSVQMFLALGSASYDRNRRWVVGLTGVLAVVIGVLCLTDPIQTLKVIGILIGIFWIVVGLGDLVGAFLPSTPGSRIWDIVKGVVSIGAGIFLVANPKVSLGFLVIVTCVWLLGYGFIVIVGALRLRTEHIHSVHPVS
ncbi:HdeD family acid-resistance protein [Marmoricola sp. URHB0036]|uniref:HdeD family acid-resistance protein n=1 Tax=Marmoricola sp. URHB0036 TaxID=1298863 RepID=UPI00040642F6|nr:DUF308 domain-containing protein [Marmoricola sp. URHB0036]